MCQRQWEYVRPPRAARRVDRVEVRLRSVRFALQTNLGEGVLIHHALARRVRLGPDGAHEKSGVGKDRLAIEVVKITTCQPGIFGELAGFLIEGG